MASHSACRALTPHSRNLTDEMIRAIAECGGTIGLNYSAGFISPDIHSHTSRIDDMVRHMKHLYQVGGIECMALGGDLDGIRGDLEIDSTDKTLWLLERLKKEGFTESQIDKIAYDNMFRLIGGDAVSHRLERNILSTMEKTAGSSPAVFFHRFC